MAAPRSTSLYAGSITSSSTITLYTVPTGKRTIIKSIHVTSSYSSTQRIVFAINNGTSDLAYFTVYCAATGTSGDTQDLEGWWVIEEGWKINISVPHPNANAFISGSELDLVY